MSCINFEDDPDPITNPYYYAQNMDAFYDAEIKKIQNEMKEDQMKKDNDVIKQSKELPEKGKPKSKLSLKRTICKPTASTSAASTSYVIRSETEKAKHLIKISIEDLSDFLLPNSSLIKKEICVQYLVKEHYDEIKNDADRLISKIVKKLSSMD